MASLVGADQEPSDGNGTLRAVKLEGGRLPEDEDEVESGAGGKCLGKSLGGGSLGNR